MEKSLKRNDIQGLRAIAVISVVLYHAWQPLAPGGFVGVDIFFVISGYVITNSILRDIELGEFSIANFYRRRVRRIFPALYTMIAFALGASISLLTPLEFMEFGKTAFSTVFFSSNIMFLNLSGYFDGASTLKPLLHTWSLSVEEQYYVVYPVFIILIQRRYPNLLQPALIVIALASVILSQLMLERHPTEAFYLAPPRAFELLLGAIVACSGPSPKISQKLCNGLSLFGLALIIVALTAYNYRVPFPGLAALLPCVGAALVIEAGKGGPSIAGLILSTRPLTFFGDMSYSLYLWHWPALVLARHYVGGELDMLTSAVCIGAAIIVAILSWRFIEEPLLETRREKLPYLRIGAVMMAVASVLCIVIVNTKGMPERFHPSTLAIFAASEDYNKLRLYCHSGSKAAIPYERNCTFGAKGSSPDVAVWGDSHGAELSVAVGERLQQEGRSAVEITASACPPATGYNLRERPFCADHNRETLRRLIGDKRIRTVILTANFSRYQNQAFEVMLSGYGDVVARLQEGGKHVVIVYPIPTLDFDPPKVLGLRSELGNPLDNVGVARDVFLQSNQRALDFLNAIVLKNQVDVVLPENIFCSLKLCGVYAPEIGVLYFNSDHLSIVGARVLAKALPL